MILGRPPDPAGLSGAVAALQAGVTPEGVIRLLVSSLEYTTLL
jgi:hypothetical protein